MNAVRSLPSLAPLPPQRGDRGLSPLPRLYRDAIVFESWEGTHNVLVEQVRRDAARLDLVPLVLADLRGLLAAPTRTDDVAAVRTAAISLRLLRLIQRPEQNLRTCFSRTT